MHLKNDTFYGIFERSAQKPNANQHKERNEFLHHANSYSTVKQRRAKVFYTCKMHFFRENASLYSEMWSRWRNYRLQWERKWKWERCLPQPPFSAFRKPLLQENEVQSKVERVVLRLLAEEFQFSSSISIEYRFRSKALHLYCVTYYSSLSISLWCIFH